MYRQKKYNKHTILIRWPLTAFFRSCCLFTWLLFFCFVWLCLFLFLFLFLFCLCFFVVVFCLFWCCFVLIFVCLFCYFVLFCFFLFLFVSWQYVFNTYSSAVSVVCMCVPCLVSIFDTCTHYFCIILS